MIGFMVESSIWTRSSDADKIVGNGHMHTGMYVCSILYTGICDTSNHSRAQEIQNTPQAHTYELLTHNTQDSPGYESITISDVEPLHCACDDVG